MRVRVQRILQQAGLASRRQAEEWIAQGRVTVNGQEAHVGDSADPEHDALALDGRAVVISKEERVYLALHKPRGYTTSLKDRHAEHLITELLPQKYGRLFPIGRLDRDSEGLILFTNDGALAHVLMHPSGGVRKVYDVWVKGAPRRSHLERMRKGIVLDDGLAKPDRVDIIRREKDRTLLKIILHEGRKREVRRIFDSVGHPVEQLIRTRYGNISIEGLEPGRSRPLTHREVRELKALVKSEPEGANNEHGIAGARSSHSRTRYTGSTTISGHQPRNSVSHSRRGARGSNR